MIESITFLCFLLNTKKWSIIKDSYHQEHGLRVYQQEIVIDFFVLQNIGEQVTNRNYIKLIKTIDTR